MEFTKREEELMNYFWSQGKAMTSNDILANCTERTWKDKYLPVMLKSLENKGAITVCGVTRYNSQYARQFTPTLTKEEYFTQLAVNGGVNLFSLSKLVFNLAARSNKEKEQEEMIEELEKIIAEMEADIKADKSDAKE